MSKGETDGLQTRLIEFIRTRLIGDPELTLEATTPLVSSGLVDSFDLVELLAEVERVSGQRLPTSRISPQDMESVSQIMALLERWDNDR